MVRYSITIILYMIAGVKISCKNVIKLERPGAGKKKKKKAGKAKYAHCARCRSADSVEPSRQSRGTFQRFGSVRSVVVLLVIKANVRHRHPKEES